MKKSILLLFLIINTFFIYSQQIYFETGKTNSTFNYENSQGETLQNIQSSNFNFINLGIRKNIFFKNLYGHLNASYNSYGAIGSDIALNNYFEWDINYLGVGVGLDYEIYKVKKLSFYVKGLVNTEFLIQGTQVLNNQTYNLVKEDDFDPAIINLRGGLGFIYKATEDVSVFTQYMYSGSETMKDIQGNLKFHAHHFGVGIMIDISKKPSINEIIDPKIDLLKKELDKNSKKIKELEQNAIATKLLQKNILDKEKEISLLKSSIKDALYPLKENGFNIEEKDGKFYVEMENKLLFKSGSWEIDELGNKTINEFGEILAANPNIQVMIVGHTDSESYKKNGKDINNWDLSTKRATTIVKQLCTNKNINPKNIIASGNGEFNPIADNSSKEGQLNNRRIEIILIPKVDKLIKLIQH
ncbi:Flagellar motor protein MotB [Lutibacter oricola]|uniref:Flagellar motor protein MotB n=1 Tax=Lutibacter oricola TaxID=762486 RepID=A0A1H2WWW5_9FLAO|nr:OmpA family protein [Lutibacter oricola]SDW85143.1 Flagellar motor protein MotB [Lutibacter oricola]